MERGKRVNFLLRHSVDSLRRIEDQIPELGRVAIKIVVIEAEVFTVLTCHYVALHPDKNKQTKQKVGAYGEFAETTKKMTKKMTRGSVGGRCRPTQSQSCTWVGFIFELNWVELDLDWYSWVQLAILAMVKALQGKKWRVL